MAHISKPVSKAQVQHLVKQTSLAPIFCASYFHTAVTKPPTQKQFTKERVASASGFKVLGATAVGKVNRDGSVHAMMAGVCGRNCLQYCR